MSQNISVESTNSSSNLAINPALQAALTSLDVQLEEELARYRRQRTGRPVMSPKGLGRNQTRKSIDLISVERAGNQPQRPALGMSTAPLASFPLFMVQPSAETNQHSAPSAGVNIADSASPGMVVAAQNPTNEHSGSQHDTQAMTPPKHSVDRGDLATMAVPQAPPEDYLESSEQLLRSLAEEEQVTPPKKHFTEKLLTPLGVGSLLLLLFSSATAVFILSNPSSFAALSLERWFGTKKPTSAQSNTEPTATNPNLSKDTPGVNGPNLAADEFVDLNLNTLSHLEASPKPSPSTSPVQVVPSLPTLPNGAATNPPAPTVVPNTALPRRAADLSSVLLPSPQSVAPYTPVPPVAPLPTPAKAAPKASTSSSAQVKNKSTSTQVKSFNKSASKEKPTNTNKSTQVKSSAATKTVTKAAPVTPAPVADKSVNLSSSYYYVLLNESGESALERARTIVPDAYVENFPKGTRIQMGAFPSESEAKTMVETLQRQGISASIYHP